MGFQEWKNRMSNAASAARDRLGGYFPRKTQRSSGDAGKSDAEIHTERMNAEVSHITGKLFLEEKSHQQKFAAAFCYGSFTVFAFPLMSAWMLAFDQDVMYWFGTYVFWWTLPIPFGFLFVFIYHLRQGRLRRGFVLGSVIIPCVIFFLLGTSLRFKAEHLRDHLLSSDCQQYPIMKELSDASKEAVQLYDKCNPRGIDILFPACADFEKWRDDTDNARTWAYLQHLETNCLCTGFCRPGIKPIWTHQKEWSHDACNMCVVSSIDAHIWRVGEKMMAMGLVILVIFLIWHFFMEPSLVHFHRKDTNQEQREYGVPLPTGGGYGSMSPVRYGSMPRSPPPLVANVSPAVPVSFRPAPAPVSTVQAPAPALLAVVDGPSITSWPSTNPSLTSPQSIVQSRPIGATLPPMTATSMPVQYSLPPQSSSLPPRTT